jgi:hypothetical protein
MPPQKSLSSEYRARLFKRNFVNNLALIYLTPTKIHGFLSASSADGGQSSSQSFVHMAPAVISYTHKIFRGFVGITRRWRTNVLVTHGSFVYVTSAPAMIGYTHKMFRILLGSPAYGRQMFFCLWTIVQNIKHCFGTKVFIFYTYRRWIFVRMFSDKNPSSALGIIPNNQA